MAVLASELLREAEKLIQHRLHPQHIINGWRKAAEVARQELINICKICNIAIDNSKDTEKFHEDLLNIAKTTLSSKLLTQDKNNFA